jgi:hypothetical protein
MWVRTSARSTVLGTWQGHRGRGLLTASDDTERLFPHFNGLRPSITTAWTSAGGISSGSLTLSTPDRMAAAGTSRISTDVSFSVALGGKADPSDFVTLVSDRPKALFAAAEEQVPKGAAAEDASRFLEGEERTQRDEEDRGVGHEAGQ